MILFFRTPQKSVIATETDHRLNQDEINELCWLYGDAELVESESMDGFFVGPRREMITPWSTNAVEITQNMNLRGILRIEEFFPVESKDAGHDPMLQRMYDGLDQTVFTVSRSQSGMSTIWKNTTSRKDWRCRPRKSSICTR